MKSYSKREVGKFLLEFSKYLEDETFQYVHNNVDLSHQQAARKAIFWAAKQLRIAGEKYAGDKQ